MTVDIESVNLKVAVLDTDYYALQAINSYLAWDRRTRVMNLSESLSELVGVLERLPAAELPDVVVFDAEHMHSPADLRESVAGLMAMIPGLLVYCMATTERVVGGSMVVAAAEGGARGFLLKSEVRLQIAWAIVYGLTQDFIVTRTIHDITRDQSNARVFNALPLPPQRQYPELTERVRLALKLTVVEGMPAHLAAHEMGISLHTVRGYVKDGYRIMEAHDDEDYPTDMTPQERAFMRFTAFEDTSPVPSQSNNGS